MEKKHSEWKAGSEHNITSIVGDNLDSNADGTEDLRNVKNISKEHIPRRRIFIEQIFHMVDTGELRMEDVMDEALSMLMVVSFQVSRFHRIQYLCI